MTVYKIFFGILISISLMTGGYLYFSGQTAFWQSQAETPIIYAQNKVFKKKPDDPGGEKIPYLDYELYKKLTGTEETELEIQIIAAKPDYDKDEIIETNKQLIQNAKMAEEAYQEKQIEKTNSENTNIVAAKFFLQIYSGKTFASAEKAKALFLDKHTSFFQSKEFVIKSVNIPSKGKYYRLYFGPYLKWQEAKQQCEILMGKKIDCLIVQP